MKKIMIAVAATIVGIVANAAAVSWSITNIQSSPSTEVSAGWLVQIYSSSVAYSFEDAKAGNIAATFTGATVSSGTAFRAGQKETDAASAGDTVTLYAVIYDAATIADAKYYIVSDTASKTVAASGADISVAFGSMAGTTAANKFLNSSWTATAAVPEPTSGLLMLLGMAGLALRRRRA